MYLTKNVPSSLIVYIGTILQSINLDFIHWYNSWYFSFTSKFLLKFGKAWNCLPGWFWKSLASLKILTRFRTSSCSLALWWMPLGFDSPSLMSVLSISSLRIPIDLLILAANVSERFGPKPLMKDFKKLFRYSRWRSSGIFSPCPLFHSKTDSISHCGPCVGTVWH